MALNFHETIWKKNSKRFFFENKKNITSCHLLNLPIEWLRLILKLFNVKYLPAEIPALILDSFQSMHKAKVDYSYQVNSVGI